MLLFSDQFRAVKNAILLPEKLRLNIPWDFFVLNNENSHFIKIAWTVGHLAGSIDFN